MFSSGFFLLPGLAYAHTGPSVFLAYVVSGILILPAMISKAELSTAMPKAGGTYFFLDRAFGPIMGTIGGFGSYIGLVLKTAFALVGFGAYLQLYFDLPIKFIAVGLGVIFMILNLFGAKMSAKYQKIMVFILLSILTLFVIDGIRVVVSLPTDPIINQLSPFFSNGMSEFFYAIAFVFVSYAGLTKIASIAEEVKNPERNIPLGMIISLLITMLIYGLGIFIVVSVVPSATLLGDLKPIATAQSYMFDWLQAPLGLILITIAALCAFASTGNAGILASSRYPLAMARDHLLPPIFKKLNKKQIPSTAIIITAAIILILIITQSEESIAKFASAFQLLLFMLINMSVIVMRESQISTYDPGFKSPFYPWTQIFGIIVSLALISYMGILVILSLVISIISFFIWYKIYAEQKVQRRGAIYHWFSRLGALRFNKLETELWSIIKEKGIRDNDPINSIIDNATIIDLNGEHSYQDLVDKSVDIFSKYVSARKDEMALGFLQKAHLGSMPITKDVCVSGLRFMELDTFKLIVIRCKEGFSFHLKDVQGNRYSSQKGKIAFFLISPESKAAIHLRLIAYWISEAEEHFLVDRCMLAESVKDLKRVLCTKNRKNIILVKSDNKFKDWIGLKADAIPLRKNQTLVYIIRNNVTILPDDQTMIQENDILFILKEL